MLGQANKEFTANVGASMYRVVDIGGKFPGNVIKQVLHESVSDW